MGNDPPIGQPTAIALLKAAIAKNRVAPAYLFAGPDGIGRSIAARYFVRLLLAGDRDRHDLNNHPDFLWVEPSYSYNGKIYSPKEAEEAGLKRKFAPQIRLEQIRNITRFLSRPPLEAPRSAIVLEGAETMGESAANGLLKTLEEPGRATLILLAPSVESLLQTLVSRCQRIPFYRLCSEDMERVLRQTGYEEILHDRTILSAAQGSPGAAIAAWKQLENIPPELLSKVTQLPRSISEAMMLAREISSTLDIPDQLWLLDYLQQIYWQQFLQGSIRVSPLQSLENARHYLRSYVQPRLVWEVMLMEAVL
ncbi:MAG TPA: DNA polymerase III subunit delta' [Oscillatoriales cyanobacterium M59_W2019_021]|nr:DNA polymerase III subunit delta' [Oscillatoriales cyanobacterium M4454_W2019_049]HIK52197.1 DNA polymerase III subunit delta' [Oscillatoriales cyanobacterium M59_W2019_021]